VSAAAGVAALVTQELRNSDDADSEQDSQLDAKCPYMVIDSYSYPYSEGDGDEVMGCASCAVNPQEATSAADTQLGW
jgi:hypothetical protein